MSGLLPFDENEDASEWAEDLEGQLAIDVYHTPEEVIVKAPIAGVKQEDLEVSITDEHLVIKGERHDTHADNVDGYIVQECYWGTFSRTYSFPVPVDSDHATAKLVDGILTITVPKSKAAHTRTLPVSVE